MLNGDIELAEWGYTSYKELRELRVNGFEVDRDIHWTPTKVSEIAKIKIY
jgi:hypothetical protein